MSRPFPALLAVGLATLVALTALLRPSSSVAGSMPAANAAITPLLLGTLSGSATTAPGPADALFTMLAGNATTSIDIAMYDFNRVSVRDALLAAHSRGVTVRVVGDGEDAAEPGYAPFYGALLASGIQVVTDTKTSLMHNKFAVFDGEASWTGSANFTDTAFTFNAENVLVITDTVAAGIYATEFAELFSGTFSTDKTDNTAHSATVGGSPIELAFAPTDGVEQRIVSAIGTANTSLQVAMFTLTNDAIGAALIAAHDRGVAVEVILDQVAAGGVGGERDRLCAAGVTVRVENFAGKIHDKYAVVDAQTASDPLIITGSTNWTANAVEANDENLLIAHDAGLASVYAADIIRIRSAIAPGGFSCNVTPATTATPTVDAAACAPLPRTCAYLPIVQRAPAATPTPSLTPTIDNPPPRPTATSTPTRTPTPTATSQPAPGQATITFIRYDPPDTLSEYVQIQHSGGAAITMTGWTLRDLANHVYTFPSFTLAVGATVRVWTNGGTNTATDLYWGSGSAIWNNTGDTATLRDAQGSLISTYSY